ncbi:MAG: 16S rRNA (guanine(527)-N(7))-methyltransferase RsmG [Tannerella sp.]|jgi:16S rRNA (guanine527-N7)-methyltransferase|nr:16S rRNA (guanine(527)-N(7))-methyltransferase RsmG [Tannerella sp.]
MNNLLLKKYFPGITGEQTEQFDALGELYSDWNTKINVISRKDIDNLYMHHILHSLGIAKFIHFTDGTHVMDVGTGGGFPGIPLAILFPEVRFHLIDSIGKKIKVAQSVADAVGLRNVTTRHCRIEEEKNKFDFVVSRAVMTLPELVKLVRKNVGKGQRNALPDGLICLKGGDLHKEISSFGKNVITTELSNYFDEEFFETKKIIYIPL